MEEHVAAYKHTCIFCIHHYSVLSSVTSHDHEMKSQGLQLSNKKIIQTPKYKVAFDLILRML